MSFAIILISLAVLIVLISYFKIDPFLSFIVVSVGAAAALGIPLREIPAVLDKGIGNILGSLTLVIVLGAMLGKLVAESGAARRIADVMVSAFGMKYLAWGLAATGFIVGIPLFYGVGFVLLIPIIFSISYEYKLPAVATGLPMLAALSVAFGYLPPSPSPVALIAMFGADMGKTLLLGIVVAIPAVIVSGPLFARTLTKIKTGPLKLFEHPEETKNRPMPGKANSFIGATLPVFLLIAATCVPYIFPDMGERAASVVGFFASPSIVMFLSVAVVTYTLGIRQGRSIREVMGIYADAVKDIAGLLLIIAGSGIFKEVMEATGVSLELAGVLTGLPVHPLILGWLMGGIIRACVGSATIAALTTAGVMMPLVAQTEVNPELMVLALGAGSLMFSHVNDSGFWMFKEYFNISIKDTLRSWTVMETLVGVVGIIGIMIVNIFV